MGSRRRKRFRVGPVLLALVAVAYVMLLVGMPMAMVFVEAFREGWSGFKEAVTSEETLHAIKLTVGVCAVVVPLNTLFGVAAAWVLARQRFWGKTAVSALINIPLAISPIIAGLMVVLLYSPTVGMLAGPVNAMGIKILFNWPGLVIATLLVTLPLVTMEVLPALELADRAEEQAARSLGASRWTTFWRVTLPAIRWSVVYGVVLCTARAAGEFGAVSGVSGKLIGETNTLTLHIERLYAEYETVPAYAASTLLAAVSVVTLALHLLLPRAGAKGRRK